MTFNRLFIIVGIALVFSISGLVRAQVSCIDPVDTASGAVRGASEADTATCVWKGIPFARAPVGQLRWQSTKPHPGWSGVRDATEWGARCMQKGMMELFNADPSKKMSEDCLFLNIWRPRKSGTFPVMVWIHGGGYFGGTGNTPMYWGDRLAETGDVVVVTFNYRLGPFGFFANPALRKEDANNSTGNQGSLDQAAAIRWVHDNIEGFGGDPGNVTIFGESAGGWSICTMLATPLNRGMFQRAILESGGCEKAVPLDNGYQKSKTLADDIGCASDDLLCLRSVSADDILDEVEGISLPSNHVDGYLLTDTPLAMIRSGNYNDASFMAGHNLNEFGKALKLTRKLNRTRPAMYEERLVNHIGVSAAEAKKLVELYPLSEFNNKPVDAYGRMFGADAMLACPSYIGLSAAAAQQQDVYYYRFEYSGMRFKKYLGAAHAMELPFIFNSMDRPPIDLLYGKKNMGEAQDLSKIIQGYWLNFAKTGDPNGPGLPEWPAYDTDKKMVQILDVDTRTERADFVERCSFWDEYSKEHSGDGGSINVGIFGGN